ncbi:MULTISPECIES: hypothetical protein [unclassified Coleofasciculus]|nr:MULTISPECIES: hypothetical protein [unclassified Coleofasciculus]
MNTTSGAICASLRQRQGRTQQRFAIAPRTMRKSDRSFIACQR